MFLILNDVSLGSTSKKLDLASQMGMLPTNKMLNLNKIAIQYGWLYLHLLWFADYISDFL
jgi:hypothetical protein